jgi:allantoate deiminase
MTANTARADQIIVRCRELARCTEVAGETTRTFLAPAMRRVHALVGDWMRAAGMHVHVDAAGNLRGILPAADPGAPRLLIGSHLDTVTNAGAFDGPLGVVLGVAVVEQLVQDARANSPATRLPFEIEIIGFSEEEGVRFSKPFLGSLALVGELDAPTLARRDRHGISVADAIRSFGLDPSELSSAVVAASAFSNSTSSRVLCSRARAAHLASSTPSQDRRAWSSSSPARPTTPAPRPWARFATMR